MYPLGAKVTYPQHGAGVIVAIEEREILGVTRKYYVLNFDSENGRVLIPVEGCKGLRKIVGAEELQALFTFLSQGPREEETQNWNKRYRENLDRIRTGDIYEVADVVRELTLRARGKGLAAGEQRMLVSARTLLVSEIALALGETAETIEQRVDKVI